MTINRSNEYAMSCCFAIHGLREQAWDANLITARLGMQPTRSWAKGDANDHGGKRFRNAWIIDSTLSTVDINKHLEDMLRRFQALDESALAFLRICESEFGFTFSNFRTSVPPITFSPRQLQAIARLSADLDVDILFSGQFSDF